MDRKDIRFTTVADDGSKSDDSEGGVVIDVHPGVVMRATTRGTLILCDKCDRYEWDCKTYPSGDTWCTRVCVSWTCREVPAADLVGRMLTNR